MLEHPSLGVLNNGDANGCLRSPGTYNRPSGSITQVWHTYNYDWMDKIGVICDHRSCLSTGTLLAIFIDDGRQPRRACPTEPPTRYPDIVVDFSEIRISHWIHRNA